jgi:hypothetical protein
MSSNPLHTELFTYIIKLIEPNLQHRGAEGNELMRLWSHMDLEECKEWERLVESQTEEFSLICCVSQVLELIIRPFISFTYSCMWCRKSNWDRNLLLVTMQWYFTEWPYRNNTRVFPACSLGSLYLNTINFWLPYLIRTPGNDSLLTYRQAF